MEITRGKRDHPERVVIYGPEGIGKTTFAASFPEPLFIDTEGSTSDIDVARLPDPETWNDMVQDVSYVMERPDVCRTLVVDTVDWAEKLCARYICRKSDVGGIEDFGYGKGYVYLAEWADRCVKTYKTKQNEITRKKYMNRMNYCILSRIGDMRLKEIKPLHCQQVLNEQAGKSKTQVNEVYQQLHFLFRYAVANELLKKDPTEHLVKPDSKTGHRRALSASERRFFIKVGLQDRRYYYFMLMLFCGCRPSEARAIMGYDIRILSNGLPALHIRGTKTENSDRVVPIPPEFYECIKTTKPDEPVAMTAKGGPITENNRARIWNSYTRQLNIEMGCKTYRNALVPPYPLAPDLVPYCLRHEYCTELARRGVDIRIAQKLMGHSDIQLTANIYTNLNQDDMAGIAEILARGDAGVTHFDAPKCTKMPANL